jgi:hypothetical protein
MVFTSVDNLQTANGKLKTKTVIVSATYNIIVAFFTLQQHNTNQRNGFFS